MEKKWWWLIVSAVLVVIAISVGLGIHFSRKEAITPTGSVTPTSSISPTSSMYTSSISPTSSMYTGTPTSSILPITSLVTTTSKRPLPQPRQTTTTTTGQAPGTGKWYKGFATAYTSWCDLGSPEDINYSCGKYRGAFAFKNAIVPEDEVARTNIVALFIKERGGAGEFRNKKIEIKYPGRPPLVAEVWDTCGK